MVELVIKFLPSDSKERVPTAEDWHGGWPGMMAWWLAWLDGWMAGNHSTIRRGFLTCEQLNSRV